MKIPQQSKRCLENREEVEYYFADFVRKGGGGIPLTDKIRKVVFEVPPKVVRLKGCKVVRL